MSKTFISHFIKKILTERRTRRVILSSIAMKTNYRLFILLIPVFLILSTACNKNDTTSDYSYLWQKLNAPYFGRTSDIEFTSCDTGYILGIDSTGGSTIIKTYDGGQTWQKIYYPYSHSAQNIQPTSQLSISPFISNILFALSYNQNVFSKDGGYHWNIIDTNLNSTWGKYHFLTPADVVRSGEYIYTSKDSGFTWSKVYDSQGGFAFFTMLQFTSSQTGYTCGGIAFDATNYGLMAKTTNGGNTWQPINYPFHNIEGISFTNDNTGYIVMDMDSGNTARTYAGGSDLYKTNDGGNTWQIIKKNMFIDYYNHANYLYFRNEQDGFALGTGIYHTTNGGISWQNEFPAAITNLFFPNPSCCYAIDKQGNVFKRTF